MATFSEQFKPPDFYNFKPFFTLQPVLETREKQLKLWRDLILKYCSATNVFRIVPASFPYFANDAIGRRLGSDGVNAVVEYLLQSGNAEWEDLNRSSLLIMWKSPEVLGNEIYSWASKTDILGTVFTIYELHSGDEYMDSGFHGTDSVLIRKALKYLENNRKCVVIPGSSADEDGVKFLAT